MRVFTFLQHLLGCPDDLLCFPVTLRVVRAAGNMLKLVFIGKFCVQLRCILRTIVRYDNFGNAMSYESTLSVGYYFLCCRVISM